jgi:sRNA-binding protein
MRAAESARNAADAKANQEAQERQSQAALDASSERYNKINRETSSGCFPKGTLILTPNGKIDISKINKGDVINTVCAKTNHKSNNLVLKVVKHDASLIWEIKLNMDN